MPKHEWKPGNVFPHCIYCGAEKQEMYNDLYKILGREVDISIRKHQVNKLNRLIDKHFPCLNENERTIRDIIL